MSGENYPRVVGVINSNAKTRKCLMLDIDECLISIAGSDFDPQLVTEIKTNPKYMSIRPRLIEINLRDRDGIKGEGRQEYYWGVKRPHLDIFLSFALDYFYIVGIWSAGRRRYVERITDTLFFGFPHPYIVMNHDDVEYLPSSDPLYAEYHKPLRKVISLDPRNITTNNTLFLDNKGDNFVDNPRNGVTIPDYRIGPNLDIMMTDDISLLQFKQWLSKSDVMTSEDVRYLDKSSIFITPLTNLKDSIIPFGSYSQVPRKEIRKDGKIITDNNPYIIYPRLYPYVQPLDLRYLSYLPNSETVKVSA